MPVSDAVEQPDRRQPADPASRNDSRAGGDDAFEDQFHHDHPWVWYATWVGPLVLSAAILVAIGIISPGHLQKLVPTALATFLLLGRFVILLGENGAGSAQLFHARELLAMVLYMDLTVAVLLSFHLSAAFKLPYFGPRLRAVEADGRFILASNPWMRRLTFLGVVAFVMFPLAATGSIGGSIFGRLLGMSRVRTLAGVALGSVLGCGMMYFGSAVLNQFLSDYQTAKYVGGGAVLLVFVWVLNSRYRKLRAMGQHRRPPPARKPH